ncbi:MAG: Ig-like domain-containing protein [Nitrospirae bacterium]|nr:Ig-like domain-containing protein [Nitrospirota bacterium]
MQSKLTNRRLWIIPLIAIFLMLFSYTVALARSFAKVTIIVTDENNQPLSKANVHLGFRVYTKGGWSSETNEASGLTDSKGYFTASSFADDFVGFTITKDGYYESGGDYKFKESSIGRWQPWNPEIIVVMRKIEMPVPMYARDTSSMHPVLEIPVNGKSVGYDLMESDWVSPYGKGKHPDMFFRLDRKFVSRDDFEGTLTITFPNKYDGIQLVKYDRKRGSNFKLPRIAPEDGYQSKLVRTFSNKPGEPYKDSTKDDNNYIFRVRSEEKDGKFLRAMHGKIHGDIQFDMRGYKTAELVFKYFLNPDFTRNLESGKNLIPGVQVGID